MFTYSKTKSNLLTVTFRYSCFKNFHPSFSSHFFFTLLPIPRVVFGNSNGLAVVDYIQKTVVLNLGTVELYGSNDPYQRQPRSPRKTRQPSGGNKKRDYGSQKEKDFIHFSEHDSFFFFFFCQNSSPHSSLVPVLNCKLMQIWEWIKWRHALNAQWCSLSCLVYNADAWLSDDDQILALSLCFDWLSLFVYPPLSFSLPLIHIPTLSQPIPFPRIPSFLLLSTTDSERYPFQ